MLLKSHIISLIKVSFALITIYFYMILVSEYFSQLPEINLINKIPLLILLVTIFILISILLSIAWHYILKSFSFIDKFQHSFISYNLSQFGKYFPGNVGQYISRIYLGSKMKIPFKDSLGFIILESFWLIVAALVLSIFIDFKFINNFFLSDNFLNSCRLLVAVFIFFIMFYIYKEICKINFMKYKLLFKFLELRESVVLFFIYLIYFSGIGLVFYLILNFIMSISALSLLNIFGIISLCWIAGFIIPGAPAGLGVRELMLVYLLSSFISTPEAITASIIFRLISLFSDLLLFLSSYLLRKFYQPIP